MLSKAQIEILIDDTIIYRPNDNVTGLLVVKAKKNFDIRSISLQFSGALFSTYVERVIVEERHVRDGNIERDTRTEYIYHQEPHHFFTETEKFNSTLDIEKFEEDEIKEYSFNFVFPLTATCRECGRHTVLPPTINQIQGDSMILSSCYSLVAEVVPDSTFSTSSRCTKVLNFQPIGNENLIPLANNFLEIPKESVIWRSKLKRNIDERYLELYSEKYELKDSKEILSSKSVSNPLRKSHRYSRSIRKIFNKNYKSEIYNKLVGDVKLEVELILLSRLYNNLTSIPDSMNFFIRSRIENLKPDFLLYCGESSQLGSFIITDLLLSITTNYSICVHGQRGFVRKTTPIFQKSYGYELTFDLLDFLPSINDPLIREWKIPIQKLFNNENINLTSILLGPNYSSACGVLEINHTMNLKLGIASNLEESPSYSNFSCDIVLI